LRTNSAVNQPLYCDASLLLVSKDLGAVEITLLLLLLHKM